MRLRTKIFTIFILSIIISVIIFIFINWYLINNGWWAGINTNDMERVANGAASQVQKLNSFNYLKIKSILNEWKEKYNGIELELLSERMKLVYTTASNQQIETMSELMESLSKHGEFSQTRWIVAREINMANDEKGFLVIIVPAKYYTALSFSINGLKGAGIFGKMFLIGLGITLIISSSFAYMFSKSISERFNILYKELSKFELDNMDIAINDTSQDEIGYLAVAFEKMSERLKNQVNVEKAYHEQRKKLVSNISHDIRTPLTSIIGYSESLENNVYEDEEEEKRYITIIRKKALYMEKLLRELLDFSRLESGHFVINKQKVDVSEMLRELLIEYLPVLQESMMEIDAEIPEYTIFANIDRDEIARVIRNLLDNAIKYGKDGVIISFTLADDYDNLRIELKDNGCGIDSKNLEFIFERFFREDKSRSTKEGGMGLGLAIADEIIKMHGGQIYVKSIHGKGSTFTVVLPKGL